MDYLKVYVLSDDKTSADIISIFMQNLLLLTEFCISQMKP